MRQATTNPYSYNVFKKNIQILSFGVTEDHPFPAGGQAGSPQLLHKKLDERKEPAKRLAPTWLLQINARMTVSHYFKCGQTFNPLLQISRPFESG